MQKLSINQNHSYVFSELIYENIGTGSQFWKGIEVETKRIVGIKIQSATKKEFNTAMIELRILNNLCSRTTAIPSVYNSYYDVKKEKLFVFMQYIDKGVTLHSLMQNIGKLPNATTIIKQLLSILKVLHQNNYQHRDLKPENVMIRDEQIFLIDFNLTGVKPIAGEGSEDYRAPEQIFDIKGIGRQNVDIFAIGVIFYEMVIGEKPLYRKDYKNVKDNTWRKFTQPIEKDPSLDKEINSFICKCMALRPEDRYKNAGEAYSKLRKL